MFTNNKSWYEKHLIQIKRKAGKRYSPELNIELPISEIFDGLSRTETFYTSIKVKYGELIREFKYVPVKYEKDEIQNKYKKIKKNIDELIKLIKNIKKFNINPIPWEEIQKQTKDFKRNSWKYIDLLREEIDQIINITASQHKNGSYQQSPEEKFKSDIYHIYKTQEIVSYFDELSLSTKAKLTNHPFLLLTGSAGTGKTHLLCDIAEKRIKSDIGIMPTILVFGEFFFKGNDFWTDTLRQLGIGERVTKETFLKKIDELGKKSKCRSLLIIDALNENLAQAPDFWKTNLDSIIDDINKYPNIGLILSIRSGFENQVLLTRQQKLLVIVKVFAPF